MSTTLVNFHGKVNLKVAPIWYEEDKDWRGQRLKRTKIEEDKDWMFFAFNSSSFTSSSFTSSSSLSICLQINCIYLQHVPRIYGLLYTVFLSTVSLYFSLFWSINSFHLSSVFICLQIVLIVQYIHVKCLSFYNVYLWNLQILSICNV